MLPRMVFIASYGIGLRLFSLQVIGVFVVFRWFLEAKKGGALEGARLGLRALLEGAQVLLKGV